MSQADQKPAAFTGPRTPENIRTHGNHLLGEPSVYLQQHAHNPVDWYPWGPEALERSQAEDKPIFLSIGYSSCHWCHVMEHEVFEKDDVALFLNEHFICIKVDREERPDLDSVYMEAVQMMTGRGGWPMTVFLTPDLKPFHGGTYFPHDAFMHLIQRVDEVFRTRRAELDQQGHQVAQRIAASSALASPDQGPLTEKLIDDVVQHAREAFDAVHAGFQQSQKFPTPARWRFLLHEYRRQPDPELKDMIIATLEAMQGGGIHDHLGGGFHRYTVDPDWTVPHFEKMLYDNGQLAGLFIEAAVVFDRDDFLATGTDVLDFLIREMRSDEGGFYASFDADSGGEEGTYYIWNKNDITAAVGQADGPVLCELLGVTDDGNFEDSGSSVLTRRADRAAIAEKYHRDPEELAALFDHYRPALRRIREGRTPPGLDRKIITSWNGLVIGSLAQAYAVTGREKYLTAGEETARYLLTKHRDPSGALLRSSSGGRTSGQAILDDYAFLADALLELYQVSGRGDNLRAARELVDHVRNDFTREGGGFHLTASTTEAPLGRRVEIFDSVTPAGNSVMLHDLLRLEAITGETAYLELAKRQLSSQVSLLERAGFEMAWACDAARKILDPFYTVVIAGSDQAMFHTLISRLPENAVVCPLPAEGPDPELLAVAPALEGKAAMDGRTTAFVCRYGTCKAPTSETAVMLRQIGIPAPAGQDSP